MSKISTFALLIFISGWSSASHAIYGGTVNPSPEARAVAALIDFDKGQFCSGTLIAPNKILSAAHCLRENPDLNKWINNTMIFFGNDATEVDLDQMYDITNLFFPNDEKDHFFHQKLDLGDFMLLSLKASLDNLSPIPLISAEEFAKVNPGDEVRLIGYGDQGNGTQGIKMETTVHIKEIDDQIVVLQEDGKGALGGDSGGSALININNRWVLLGVIRSALKKDGYTSIWRGDLIRAWLTDHHLI